MMNSPITTRPPTTPPTIAPTGVFNFALTALSFWSTFVFCELAAVVPEFVDEGLDGDDAAGVEPAEVTDPSEAATTEFDDGWEVGEGEGEVATDF